MAGSSRDNHSGCGWLEGRSLSSSFCRIQQTNKETLMTLQLTTAQVWQEIEANLFAVLGMVTPTGEARTAGIVYVVDDHKLYIGTDKAAWKTKHIVGNPHVSITIPIAKRIPFLPWIKIPAATIT